MAKNSSWVPCDTPECFQSPWKSSENICHNSNTKNHSAMNCTVLELHYTAVCTSLHSIILQCTVHYNTLFNTLQYKTLNQMQSPLLHYTLLHKSSMSNVFFVFFIYTIYIYEALQDMGIIWWQLR